MPELFAYDWKNALALRVMKSSTAGGTREYVPRVYFAYSQLIYMKESEDDITFEKDQIILIGILSTLCVTARQDFLVLDNKRAEVFLWKNGMQQMGHFYCDRTSAVSKDYLSAINRTIYICISHFRVILATDKTEFILT